jgi:hypothetical protein
MKRVLGFLAIAALGAVSGCASKSLDADTTGGGSGNTGGGAHQDSGCNAARRQELSLVDEVSTAQVSILSESAGERTLYVDASVGGLGAAEKNPWVYLSLKTGMAVAVTDLEALDSTAWDLGFKRTMIRTNGGDSGPGSGGAIRIGLAWDKVSRTTLGNAKLPIEVWFDDMCMIGMDMKDATGNLVTTYSAWSEYDEANHVVSAAPDVVFITAGGDGTLYKVQIEDYYSTPSGQHGTVAGRYKLRTAALP